LIQEAKRNYKGRCGEEKKQRKMKREKEKGISERGKTNAKMGRVFHEISGRGKGKMNGRNEMKKKQTAPEGIEITVEEVEKQIKKLKKRKAPRRDGGKNEAWMYRTEGIVERVVEVINGV
jgi:hypothetical protein